MLHFDSLPRMRLVILGSGTSVPHAQRTSSAYWLEASGGFLLLDLAPFLFGMKWAPQTQQRTRPLRLFGPAGIKILLHAFDQANNYRLLHQPFAIEVIEMEPASGFELLPALNAVTF